MNFEIEKNIKSGRKVLFAGFFTNLFLMIIKFIAGTIGKSSALFADAVHTLSDFATDVIAFFGFKVGFKEKDKNHPYGHGKVETLSAFIIGAILIIVGAGILYNGVMNIVEDKETQIPKLIALIVAFVSILGKEIIFRYTLHYGKKIRSDVLIANAWHHRSDALSSIATLIGISGAYFFEIVVLDIIAAICVSFFIIKVGYDIIKKAIKILVESSIDQNQLKQIQVISEGINGVCSVNSLKARSVGRDIVVDIDIVVDAAITVSEGHRIAREVKKQIIEKVKEVNEVHVHVDPKDIMEVSKLEIVESKYNKISEMVKTEIEKIIKNVDNLKGYHRLKLLSTIENKIIVHLDIEVQPDLTVSESHKLAKIIKRELFNKIDSLIDVRIHVDPYGETEEI